MFNEIKMGQNLHNILFVSNIIYYMTVAEYACAFNLPLRTEAAGDYYIFVCLKYIYIYIGLFVTFE